jgi:chaperone LolA
MRALCALTLAVVSSVTACGGGRDNDNAANADTSTAVTSPVVTSAGGPAASAAAPNDTAPADSPRSDAARASDADGAQDGAQDGARILARTAAKYNTVNSMRADFTMRVENPLLRTSATTRGRIYQKRPDKIALRFTDPAGDLIVGDGRYFWVYTPGSMSKDQVLRSEAAPGSNAVDLQAQFVGDPVKRFNYTMQGTEKVGSHTTDVLRLVPKQAAQYTSLKVWIDRDDALIRKFDITESSGVVRHLELNNLQVNVAIDPSVFRYSPPAGVRIVGQ